MTYNRPQRRTIKLIVLMAMVLVFAMSCWKANNSAREGDLKLTAIEDANGGGTSVSDKNYGRFLHTVEEHEGISCNECHRREGTQLKFAGHNSCIDCHFREFVESKSQICAICHTTSQAEPEELLAFPARFNEGFNMMFNHALHAQGSAKPPQGCASCHRPQGSSQTIPAGISTHSQCFTCHTQESKIGSCNVCHDIAPYRRTIQRKSAVLKYVFSHADHTSRQGVTCLECHSTRANAPQGKQVVFPVAAQHFVPGNARGAVTCASCHNNRRAFGERDFADCKRCHTGSGFDMMPN